jgi:DNA polymerase
MLDFNSKTEFDGLDYDGLFKTCRECTRCGLAQTRIQVVVGTGPAPCDVMVIGEGPGQQEDEQGKPFVGKAGQLLTKIFESVGIARENEVYITNIVKCRPPENRVPHPTEVEACRPYLIRQIQVVKPKILLLLGSPSLKAVLDEGLTITKARGQWYQVSVDYMESPLYVMPLFHPSFLLRNQSKEKGSPKWQTWQDIREVKSAMEFYRMPS